MRSKTAGWVSGSRTLAGPPRRSEMSKARGGQGIEDVHEVTTAVETAKQRLLHGGVVALPQRLDGPTAHVIF